MPDDIVDPLTFDRRGGLILNRIGTLIYMPELTTTTYGGFVQGKHRFADRFAIDGGARRSRVRPSTRLSHCRSRALPSRSR